MGISLDCVLTCTWFYGHFCSLSLWRVARGSKLMRLELIHGWYRPVSLWFLMVQTSVFMVPHGTNHCLYGSSWYRKVSLWFLMVQTSVFMVPHGTDQCHGSSLYRPVSLWFLMVQTSVFMVHHGTDQCLYGSSLYRPVSLWFLMVQTSVFMVPLPPPECVWKLLLGKEQYLHGSSVYTEGLCKIPVSRDFFDDVRLDTASCCQGSPTKDETCGSSAKFLFKRQSIEIPLLFFRADEKTGSHRYSAEGQNIFYHWNSFLSPLTSCFPKEIRASPINRIRKIANLWGMCWEESVFFCLQYLYKTSLVHFAMKKKISLS